MTALLRKREIRDNDGWKGSRVDQQICSVLCYPSKIKSMTISIRKLENTDPERISSSFKKMGWDKPASQYEKYLIEQAEGIRDVLVATTNDSIGGYLTIVWRPHYPSFAEAGIPEIQDLNVFSEFRNRGIGSSLIGAAERQIVKRSKLAGIGVGLHPGYNSAQRLYVNLGYVPNGKGVTYRNVPVAEGMTVNVNDDLVLWFTKELREG